MGNPDYILIKPPSNYPGKIYSHGYCYEHHVVWWENTKEIVPDSCVVHHENGDKRDNRFSNLELVTRAQHTSLHSEPPEQKTRFCSVCGKAFTKPQRYFRFKESIGQQRFHCSRQCSTNKGRRDAWAKLVCPVCDKVFEVRNSEFRRRTKQNRSNRLACSRSCGASLKNL